MGRERAELETVVGTLSRIDKSLGEAEELHELASDEDDSALLADLIGQVDGVAAEVARLEFRRMFSGKMDAHNAFIDIQAGSGGTEAQDWAAMLFRMYLRWGEKHGFAVDVLDESPGEVAGIKSASLHFRGEYAFGWLRTETGVHRLVRKSPFDSGHRRHTSFAAVFVAPEIEDDIEIELNPADLRVDVFRSSGAGRPAREQDRVGDPHHAHSDRHRRAMPERALAAQEPCDRDESDAREALRARGAEAQGAGAARRG